MAPGLPRMFPPLRSLDSRWSNLPRQPTPLIGRDEALAEIEPLIREHPLVTLVGTGGVGKTRVALQAGADLLEVSGDGVWVVELAPTSDPALVASAIAVSLSLREQPERSVFETLVHYLKDKRLLLILDNCEQVIEEVAKIAEAIVQQCRGVRLLATSREPLRIAAECVYRLPPLALPTENDKLAADDALRYGAVALFAQRAAASDAKFRLTDESAPIVAEICRRLDGIALAIELAAARVKVLAPRHLARKLDERFRVLTGGSRTALPRQQTMRALIDWSYDLLAAKEQRLFRRLAIFTGGWALETAAAVCADDEATDDAIEQWEILDLLSSLVDKSLVQVETTADGTRYRLLESMRQYARERLSADEEQMVARAHAIAYVALAEELEAVFETTPEDMWLRRVEPELENFRAALRWGFGPQGDVLLGQRLVAALRPAWTRLAAAEGLRHIQVARDACGTETPAAIVAALDLAEAVIAVAFARPKTARDAAERALVFYTELGVPLRAAQARHLFGRALVNLDQTEQGEIALRQALEDARAAGVPSVIGDILQSLAIARSHAGDVAGSRSLFAEALALFRSVGAERVCAHIAGNLAEAEFHEGNAEEALRLENEALATYRAFNHKLGAAISLSNIAAYLIALERYDDARTVAREGLAAARDTQWEAGVAWCLQHLAATAALRGDLPRGARVLGYVDARLTAIEALRQYTEQQERDKVFAALRDTLGEEQLANLMTEGAAWTEDRAVAEALAV
ncbi:MAG: tetratricopeptide repeat protein [Candidatus Eremiobacteraeota bacterium]|nr:tetratricopeptide repeat protein [Candidatus Eremiobacteraeota bacterium]